MFCLGLCQLDMDWGLLTMLWPLRWKWAILDRDSYLRFFLNIVQNASVLFRFGTSIWRWSWHVHVWDSSSIDWRLWIWFGWNSFRDYFKILCRFLLFQTIYDGDSFSRFFMMALSDMTRVLLWNGLECFSIEFRWATPLFLVLFRALIGL